MQEDELFIKISSPEKIWLTAVYEKNYAGNRPNFKELWSENHRNLPRAFDPRTIDKRLLKENSEEIKLRGSLALTKDASLLNEVDSIVNTIRTALLGGGNVDRISITDIERRVSLDPKQISMLLHQLSEFGEFYSGLGYVQNSQLIQHVDIGSQKAYYNYIHFPGIEKCLSALIGKESYEAEAPFSIEEMAVTNEKIDRLFEEIKKSNADLKDEMSESFRTMKKELDELKALYSLGKKTWRQILIGKLVEMVTAGIIDQTVSSRIADEINPLINKLLGK